MSEEVVRTSFKIYWTCRECETRVNLLLDTQDFKLLYCPNRDCSHAGFGVTLAGLNEHTEPFEYSTRDLPKVTGHKPVHHATYTGKGCAICGREDDEHET